MRLRHLLPGVVLMLSIVSLASAQQAGEWEMIDTTRNRYSVYPLADDGQGDFVLIPEGSGITPTVMRSVDRGKSWDVVRSHAPGEPFEETWTAVAHPTAKQIIITGDSSKWLGSDQFGNPYNKYWSVLTISSDGGTTWDHRVLDSNTRLLGIAMCDSSNGIISKQVIGNVHSLPLGSYPDSIMITADGWRSWQSVPIPVEVTFTEQVFCFSPEVFAFVGYDSKRMRKIIYRTTDGGKNWALSEPLLFLNRLAFVDSLNGWGCGSIPSGISGRMYGVIAQTTDGGMSWSTLLDSSDKRNFREFWSIDFTDTLNGIVTGRYNLILRTRDGGKSWSQELPPPPIEVYSGFGWVSYPEPDLAIAVCRNGPIIRYGGRETLAPPFFTAPQPKRHPVDSILIEWTPVDGADRYQVQISARPMAENVYDPFIYDKDLDLDTTLSGTSMMLYKLEYDYRYSVRIRSLNSTQQSVWNENLGYELFYTLKQGAILPPTIITPRMYAVDVPLPVRISWEPIVGAGSYEIIIKEESYNPVVSIIIGDTVYLAGGLKLNTEYSVQVRGFVGGNFSEYGYAYFRTGSVAGIPEMNAERAAGELVLYPNPATERLTILLPHLHETVQRVSIHNVLGEELSEIILAGGQENVDVDVASLPPGRYLLRLTLGDGNVVTRTFSIVR